MAERRNFIKGMTAIAASALTGGCQRAPGGPPPLRRIKLGDISRFSAAETLLFVERLLVRHDRGGLSAMSLVCTHQACMVHADEKLSGKYICPCHGSRFSLSGQVEAGPANRDLPWMELEIDQEQNLWALFGKQVSPDWRLPYGGSA